MKRPHRPGQPAEQGRVHRLLPGMGVEAAQCHRPERDTWYCTAECPDWNTALPATLTQVNVALPLPAANRSPMRPPQPEVTPSDAASSPSAARLSAQGLAAPAIESSAPTN